MCFWPSETGSFPNVPPPTFLVRSQIHLPYTAVPIVTKADLQQGADENAAHS